jgi:hypothetical protein
MASEVFFDCLVALVEQPLSAWCGYHSCDLGWCGVSLGGEQTKLRYKGHVIFLGDTDILVPGDDVVYRAPSLILHYIRCHRYLPPPCFVKAVLSCPSPRSQEYSAAIKRLSPCASICLFNPAAGFQSCHIRQLPCPHPPVAVTSGEEIARTPRVRPPGGRLFA